MQTSRNGIHMLCSIQTHKHIDTSSMKSKIKHNISHHYINYAMHAFLYINLSHSLFLITLGLVPMTSRTSFHIHTYHHVRLVPRQ
jgi:hypothetical protein